MTSAWGTCEPHPDVARLAATFAEQQVPTYDRLGITRSRAAIDNVVRIQGPRVEVAAVRDVLVDGAAGRLPARVYDPVPGEPLPLVLYVHGGGFVLGGIRTADGPCRRLAAAARCVVVSIDYRLAPETPFPGALDDVVAATRWVAANAAELGGAPERLVLLGDSAGGALVAAAARDLRGGPAIAAQVLLYPCLAPPRDDDAGSMVQNADGPLMTRRELQWFWSLYLREDRDAEDPRAVPLRAADLDGLPPATVVVAELDPLCDQGIEYAERLDAAGTPTVTWRIAGAAHGFWWMDGALAQAAELDERLAGLIGGL